MPRSLGFSSWALFTLLACATSVRADLRITTLTSFDGKHAARHTVYLKDNRQRMEMQPQDPTTLWSETATVYQCDQNRLLQISQRYRTYDYVPLEQNGFPSAKAQLVSPAVGAKGGEVNVTVDSVDTGEHKTVGSYTARRVKTTIRFESGPGACMASSLTETDGWYVDLPFDLACRKQPRRAGFSYLSSSSCHDRLTIKRVGDAEVGYPIEVMTTKTEAGPATVTKTELLEFSEAMLDPVLFELPEGYSPAMHTSRGADFTRANTLKNRVGNYWAALKSAVARLWP
jgi:hypothetical protein